MAQELEWLETDGLGGFASGTAALVRTRRYHALLMRAGPPSRRHVLVAGFDAHLHTPEGVHALSAQRYQPGVLAPDGAAQLESFSTEPWPTWTFRLPCGRAVRQEIVVAHGRALTTVAFTLDGSATGCRLELRPFFAGRDPHALHHENGAFQFSPAIAEGILTWNPYPGVPPIAVNAAGTYRHDPSWYRNFLYDAERARGLDDTEDLAAPGVFTCTFSGQETAAVFASTAANEDYRDFLTTGACALAAKLRDTERARRAAFASPLHRAAEAYLVRRGAGHTIIAGYPWFTDWGRDTFIALRGLCLSGGRLELARSILLEWSGVVSQGMLPNFFPEGAAPPEYNSVDASLWYVIAVHDCLEAARAAGQTVRAPERRRLDDAVRAILEGYYHGTRFGIRADVDALLYAGQAGVQLTWMDARVGERVITPRIGKPVEIQALWINALEIGARLDPQWKERATVARRNFAQRFWNAERQCLFDVVDVDFVPGRTDDSIRPNQIFAVGGLPFPLLTDTRAAQVLAAVELHLLTPLGLRSLSPEHPAYVARYQGGVPERDGAYHQGTVWPWLIGPFVEAWVRVHGDVETARARFLPPLHAHLRETGLGHISEVADADAPHNPGGCPFQAWSLGELLRLECTVLLPSSVPSASVQPCSLSP